ncbi:MAG: transpeptidase family protein [Flavobacteriales bacterium]|nr:transpeptidase family protein [Flavobacteriales bacterium]
MNIKKDILWRVILSIVLLIVFGVGLVYSIVRIQYAEGDKWQHVSDSLYVKAQDVPAIRGSIFSEDGNLLATSVPIYSVSLDYVVIRNFHQDSFNRYRTQLATLLSETFENASPGRYDTLLRDGYRKGVRYQTLIRNASYIQAQKLLTWPIFRSGRYKGGVILEERTIRRKPYGDLMARTIGHINENGIGAGIEASYNASLEGVDGKMVVRKFAGGYRPEENDLQIRPENGKDIFTTIDIHLQDIVTEALIAGTEENGAAFATAILLEVGTGKIKAIANINRTENGYRERFNHAIGTGYEPGSTIKLVSAMATLEDGSISLEDSVDINHGKLVFLKRDTFEDSGHNLPQKRTYRDVFQKSSNVGIIKTTYETFKSKPERFVKYFDKLHLTTPLETGIKGEVEPVILRPDQARWSASTLPSLSIGYSMTTSPLHMAMLYNAVANNGVMMKPYLISSIGYLGKAEKSFDPVILNKEICSPATLRLLKSMLEGVVEDGTATSLKDLPFKVAGKTGTSKISGGSGGYQKGQYYSSFVGYFPSDAPRYTLMVLVAKPTSGRYYGSSVAVPVFEQIARRVQANTLQIEIELKDTMELPALVSGDWSGVKRTGRELDLPMKAHEGSTSNLIRTKNEHLELVPQAIEIKENTMPDLTGVALRHALSVMENGGYKVQFNGYGKIVEQSPVAGAALRPGQVIYLRLSSR